MRAFLVASVFVLAVASTGCSSGGGGVSTVPSPADGTARTISANGAPGGGGAGGGGAAGGGGGGGATCPAIATTPGTVPFPRIPPAQVTDAPCWFFYFPADPSANVTRPLAINYGGPQNSVQSAIAIGGHGISQFSVYNTSKKSALTFSSLSILGPNADDFQLDPALVATAMKGVPTGNPSLIELQVTFTPSAEGARTATLQLVSDAGTQLIALNGTGLPNRPVIAGVGGSMHFIDAPPVVSAPNLMQIANLGSLSLVIQSASFGGANPGSFALFQRNGLATKDPASLAGLTLAAHEMTPEFQIGLSPTAQPGDTATFTVTSNDPLQPSVTTQLSVGTTL